MHLKQDLSVILEGLENVLLQSSEAHPQLVATHYPKLLPFRCQSVRMHYRNYRKEVIYHKYSPKDCIVFISSVILYTFLSLQNYFSLFHFHFNA